MYVMYVYILQKKLSFSFLEKKQKKTNNCSTTADPTVSAFFLLP